MDGNRPGARAGVGAGGQRKGLQDDFRRLQKRMQAQEMRLRHVHEEHVALHKQYLPTLAATQSMYPDAVCAALERAGFRVLVSAPSRRPAWPICEQKRDLILGARKVVRALEAARLMPPWIEESLELLQSGGQAWTDAEKAKIADLNWRIVAEKPQS